ncbi:UPF0223 family protein [Alkalibacillus haloalkaliphilus]|uniref:UPF0223 protein AHA02nite_10760 n=1 Tax=Alkalibacillus haloalkaliphilus TaxID=94136 RepID=A0A511W2Q2_9BACI|nr:UPF0223 family protein [Alkalibacillus haloalkaliphilus]GEN45300.1 UPF0223 protein [Alkalibacillus haloalkaliphilus]
MNYHYPIDPDWSTEQVMDIVQFFNTVEEAYEGEVEKEKVLEYYKKFKNIVPAKDEEKTMFKEFEKHSGYIPYKVVKKAQEAEQSENVTMK